MCSCLHACVSVGVCLLQVILSGSDNRYVLSNLSPSTDYEVMLTAVFQDESESDTVSVVETTCKCDGCVQKILFGPVSPPDSGQMSPFQCVSSA